MRLANTYRAARKHAAKAAKHFWYMLPYMPGTPGGFPRTTAIKFWPTPEARKKA